MSRNRHSLLIVVGVLLLCLPLVVFADETYLPLVLRGSGPEVPTPGQPASTPTATGTATATGTPTATATVTPTPTPTGTPTPTCHDILYNGGFEDGEAYWDLYRGAAITGFPYSGSYALRLGEYSASARSWEYTIPADALLVILGYYRNVSGSYGTFFARALTGAETLELEQFHLSSVGFGWAPIAYDLTSLRGHTVVLDFGYTREPYLESYVYIDEVELVVCVSQPTLPPPTPRPSPTATPWPTPTAHPTATYTAADTATRTPTNTPTGTLTPGPTATPGG